MSEAGLGQGWGRSGAGLDEAKEIDTYCTHAVETGVLQLKLHQLLLLWTLYSH